MSTRNRTASSAWPSWLLVITLTLIASACAAVGIRDVLTIRDLRWQIELERLRAQELAASNTLMGDTLSKVDVVYNQIADRMDGGE